MLVVTVDKDNIDEGLLHEPARIIREGGTVAFPTETVYGLGANALIKSAVDDIFKAKGRPNDNPLIVHISDADQVNELVSEIPENAKILMDKFWPGPLTIIMKKSDIVPENVTAGLDTVGIRFPENAVCRAFLRIAGVPVAAPSANTSGKPSPTMAEHVISDLDGKIDAVIDGGSCRFGLESTIVDVSGDVPMLLRPGSVTVEQLRSALGRVDIDPAVMSKPKPGLIAKAPGMKYKHYSPNAEVYAVLGDSDFVSDYINKEIMRFKAAGKRVGAMVYSETLPKIKNADILKNLGGTKEGAAAELFFDLRDFDRLGADVVFAEGTSNEGVGLAVSNRLNKAAGYKIISKDSSDESTQK